MTGNKKGWVRRLIMNDDGMESMEITFSMGLIAAIAGFGMIVLGDTLFTFFEDAGGDTASADFPNQISSINTLGGGGGGGGVGGGGGGGGGPGGGSGGGGGVGGSGGGGSP